MKKIFEDFIKNRIKGKVLILAVGNELRGDDGVGPYIAESLKGKISATIFSCGTALENYYNPIVKEAPDVIILLDVVDFAAPCGEIGIFEKRDIIKTGFSTHNISSRLFIELLEESLDVDIIMIGIKPKSMILGKGLSREVKEAADILVDFFIKILPKELPK